MNRSLFLFVCCNLLGACATPIDSSPAVASTMCENDEAPTGSHIRKRAACVPVSEAERDAMREQGENLQRQTLQKPGPKG